MKAYVDRFRLTVQRYFPVPAGSAAQAFVHVASQKTTMYLDTLPTKRVPG